jgi:hypothetical protein
MATPRKTSTETNRGLCAGREEGFVPAVVMEGELTAVTTPHIANHMSLFRSWFDASD